MALPDGYDMIHHVGRDDLPFLIASFTEWMPFSIGK